MATVVTWNASAYTVPATSEENWGGVTKVDGLLIALVTHGFQKTGGTFTLSADADFGVSAGLKSLYYKSRSSIVSATGIFRMANAETGIGWRNFANGGDLLLTVNASDQLTYNGSVVATSTGLFLGPNGTASAPTFSFLSDTNTGMFRSGADALGFTTGGTERLTITSGGHVGINTTAPNLGSVGGRWLTIVGTSGAAPGFLEMATPTVTTQGGNDCGGINYFNGTVHAGEFNCTVSNNGSSASYYMRFRTTADTTHLFDYLHIGGGATSTSAVKSGFAASGLTGTTAYIFDVLGADNTNDTTGESLGATFGQNQTVLMSCFRSKPYTEAFSSYTTEGLRHFYQDQAVLGTGHTVSCEVGFWIGGKATGGTVTKYAGIADNKDFSAGDFFINQSGTNPSEFGGRLRGPDGLVGTPAFSFVSDTDNGIYRIGANNWALSCGGTKTIELATTAVTVTLDTYFSSTSQSTSTSTGAINTAGGLGVAKNIYVGGLVNVVGVASFGDGAVGAPGITFTSDLDNGMYRIGANDWALAAGGTKIVELTATSLVVTQDTYFSSTSETSSGGTGAINTAGGLGVTKKIYCGGTLTVVGIAGVADGAVGTPGLAFAGDLDNGIYKIGVNNWGLTAGGTKVLDLAATSITATQDTYFSSTSDTSSGGTGAINTAGGVGISKKLYVGTTLTVIGAALHADGLVGTPGITFTSDPDCGAYRIGANDWALAAGGTKILELTATSLVSTQDTYFSSTSETSSGGTGAINTAGGVGITKKIYVGGVATFADATDSSSSTTGGTIVTGGLGVAKKLFVGTTIFAGGAVTFGGNTTSDSNLGTITSVGLSAHYFGTAAVTFQGAFTAGQAKTITYEKFGRFVTLHIPTTTAAASNATTINNTGTELPSGLRPNLSTKFAVNGVFDNSGADVSSALQIDTAGLITVYATAGGASFTASGTAGWDRAISVSYITAS